MDARMLSRAFRGLSLRAGTVRHQCTSRINPQTNIRSRSMASIAPDFEHTLSRDAYVESQIPPKLIPSTIPAHIESPEVLATVYSFPTMEPLRLTPYPSHHLFLPLRRDILYKAVVYEADGARQGSANTKWRNEVHGSTRKIRQQKGTGMARLGDKKSPMLRGGGVAFGPKPRDFSTDLPRKIYDKAWRTALSHRYRRGELVIIDGAIDVQELPPADLMEQILRANRWGNPDGRSLLVTAEPRPNLQDGLTGTGAHALAYALEDVNVKALLSLGRVIVEKEALDAMLEEHQSDL